VFFEGRFSGEYSFNHILFMVSTFLPGPGAACFEEVNKSFFVLYLDLSTDRPCNGGPL
jgi:hypothetical protein